ncbi:MAG: MFS transporter [Bacteroidales bacterium]|nr:MFS transporter [Bacteroidales bacterium]
MYSKRMIFLACCIGMMLFGIILITLGSVLPELREKMNLDDISSGTLFSILPLGILGGSLVFGPVCDKYGYKILLSLSCIFIFAGLEGIAFSPSQNILRICIFFLGFGGGAINGATNALVADISDGNKGADLSTLGAFFGVGALGMPVILGIMGQRFSFEIIVASVGLMTLAAGVFFLFIKYPLPKQPHGFPVTGGLRMLKDNLLLMAAFFLFFQSSFEGIFNNWTTSFILDRMPVSQGKALFALSAFVAGMTVMRLILGRLLRTISIPRILSWSFVLILTGLALLRLAWSINASIPGLVLVGAGLAAGFPVMLGIVGNRYSEFSGTAFSLVLSVGLIGNMSVNYLMGIIAQNFGVHHLTSAAFTMLAAMVLLAILIKRKSPAMFR